MLKKLAHYEPQLSYYKCSHLQKDPPDPAPSSLMTKSLASLKTTPSTWTVNFQGLRICMRQGRLSHTLSWRTLIVKRKGEGSSVSQTWGQHNTGGRRSKEWCNRPLVRSALYYSNTTLYCFMLLSQSYNMTYNTSSWSNAWYLISSQRNRCWNSSSHFSCYVQVVQNTKPINPRWATIIKFLVLDICVGIGISLCLVHSEKYT